MLLGQFEGKIGAKARVAFPKRFRDVLGEKVIITQGFEESLIVVSENGWKALLDGSEGKPFTFLEARETQRFLLGGAAFVEFDDKGRFILPEYLRRYAGISEDIIFLGMNRYVEMWDRKKWQIYDQDLKKNISTIARRLSEYNNSVESKI